MTDGRQTAEAAGPVAQAVATGFRVIAAGVAVVAVLWLVSNVRQVPPDSQAVSLTFGAIGGVRPSGLALSWPRPVGQVVLVPGPDRLLTLRVDSQARAQAGLQDAYTQASGSAPMPDASDYLTGDGGVVLLSATLYYRVSDAAAFLLGQAHVAPALQRAFHASAVAVAAARPLDDFLVATPERAADPRVAAQREAVRGDLVAEMNRRLAALERPGPMAGLGIRVARIDVQAGLPAQARLAFDSVLEAGQRAEQVVAQARTDATRTRQEGDRERDRVLTTARAASEERVGRARASTAAVVAVHARITAQNRPGVLDQVYRDRLASLLHQAGAITVVDPRGGGRVILPGSKAIPGISQ